MTAAYSGVADSLLRRGAAWAFPGQSRSTLPILFFHRVLPRPDEFLPDTPDVAAVADQFSALARVFNVLPLDEAVDMLFAGRLPPRAACITFDDGYRDNYEVALPLLKSLGLTATFFVSNAFIDGGRMFNDTALECMRRCPAGAVDLRNFGLGVREVSDVASRVATARAISRAIKDLPLDLRAQRCDELERLAGQPLPDDLMMSSDNVASMVRQGMSIGGHTVNHPNLAVTEPQLAMKEISDNRDALTAITGRQPRSFAYPFGVPNVDYSSANMDMARDAGYACAVSVAWGVATTSMGRYQLPRFGPTERNRFAFVARMMRMASHVRPRLVDMDVM